MGSLSSEQIEHYREHGYVIVPEVITPAQIDRYLTRAREIALGDVPEEAANRLVKDISFAKGLAPMPEDPEHALWKIMNPDRFDPIMAECMRFPKVIDAVSSLIGNDLMAFLLMFIYKPPGVPESLHPFHQDAAYFSFGPQDQCLGVWIPLDPVDADNGSLCVVPGSHQLPVKNLEVKEGINFGALATVGAEEDPSFRENAITLELPPGDCVLFNTRLLHRTSGNRTDRHRRVVTLHMASARCKHKGKHFSEFAFTLVHGNTHDGGLKPVESPSLAIKNELIGG
jgi:ectoine hydroxylase-related dioxygenase (phytanoyl-CoA dioxygenase family)